MVFTALLDILAEHKRLGNSGRECYEDYLFENSLIQGQQFRRRFYLKIIICISSGIYFWSSGTV